MARITSTIVAAFCILATAYGMECSWEKPDNIFDQLIKTCPRPIIDSSDKSYCCIDVKDNSFYCCNAEEFALKTGLGIIVPAIIAVVVIISLVVLCISCLCCTCCPWYRRRHRGTVYGNLQGPATSVHVIQPSPAHPGYPVYHQNHGQPPIYSPAMTAMPPQYSAPPPQYVQEGYVKQAPFNPDYVR